MGQNPERTKSRIELASKIDKVRINNVLTAGLLAIININNLPTNCMSFIGLCGGDLEKQRIYKNRMIKSKNFAVFSI